jgi:hypothetical protein
MTLAWQRACNVHGVGQLLTINVRDFRRFERLRILHPSDLSQVSMARECGGNWRLFSVCRDRRCRHFKAVENAPQENRGPQSQLHVSEQSQYRVDYGWLEPVALASS